MREDDLHALAMIGLIPLAGILIWLFRRKPDAPEKGQSMATPRALLGFFLVFAVAFGWGPGYAFGPRIMSMMQVLFPALVAAICAAYIGNRWIRWGSNAAFVFISMFLSSHFMSLVAFDKSRCEYTGHTDKHISYRCDKPAEAYRLWHTSFTTIYGLRTK